MTHSIQTQRLEYVYIKDHLERARAIAKAGDLSIVAALDTCIVGCIAAIENINEQERQQRSAAMDSARDTIISFPGNFVHVIGER